MGMKLTDTEKQKTSIAPSRNADGLSEAMPVVYEELRRLARRYMAKEMRGQTLQATALVNEAYIRLAGDKSPVWQNRAHFCAIAARAMRELLVERARARAALKRGGECARISLNDAQIAAKNTGIDVVALHEALDRLEAQDAELSRMVELRFFGGLSIEETAEALQCSPATVKREWTLAKAWLRRELGAGDES